VQDIGHEGSIEPIFVSVKQAAKALNISPWSCYQLLDAGKIKSQYSGRRRLVRVDSLRAYADGLPTTPEPKPVPL
jgi:excisionase family DNA binding protein